MLIENSIKTLKEALYIHDTNQGGCANNFLFKSNKYKYKLKY